MWVRPVSHKIARVVLVFRVPYDSPLKQVATNFQNAARAMGLPPTYTLVDGAVETVELQHGTKQEAAWVDYWIDRKTGLPLPRPLPATKEA